MSKLVMALDQGTTSSRTILFREDGTVAAMAGTPVACHYPQSGWVEQDPEAIWESQRQTIQAALEQAGVTMNDIAAIGITNQRESTIAWDRQTGTALGPAINWQCRRTAAFCDELKAEGFDTVLRKKTGLVTDAYFSGTKMRWMLQNLPAVQEAATAGRLCFGTIDSWLIWKLTGGKQHLCDITNASRTLVYDIHRCAWDDEILTRFGIPREALPEVRPSSGVLAEVAPDLFGGSAPIAGIAGDQQAALFGQACFTPGMAKNTYGTGCFMMLNTGNEPVASQQGLLTTIGWQIGDEVTYALEGSVFIAGALMQWLRDGLGLFSDASETEAMALSVEDSGGVFIVPAFVGLGAPHWDPYARGTIVGLTRDSNRNHLVRAGLEAIAFQSAEILQGMAEDTGLTLQELRIDGGASANGFLCQFQSDLLGLPVTRPQVIETTAMGAAFLAGLGVGIWKDPQEIQSMWAEDRKFHPQLQREQAQQRLQEWSRAVDRSRGWLS